MRLEIVFFHHRRRSLTLASQQKSFLFLLEEKIRRAQNQKSRENFFAGFCSQRAGRRAGFIRRGFPENGFGFRSGCGAKQDTQIQKAKSEMMRPATIFLG